MEKNTLWEQEDYFLVSSDHVDILGSKATISTIHSGVVGWSFSKYQEYHHQGSSWRKP